MYTSFLQAAFACYLLLLSNASADSSPAKATNASTAAPSQGINLFPSKVTVNISADTRVVGESSSNVDTFRAIPYADPPIGSMRLRPPRRFSKHPSKIDGTKKAPACPQVQFSRRSKEIFGAIADSLLDLPFLQEFNGQEDCLTLDIARPAGTKAGDKLPVLYWVFPGGFTTGSTSSYDPSGFVQFSTMIKQPFIYVAVNYRLGGFGFLPGKEIQNNGSANLGLLDQRMGLEWVADNIESFGGDPERVTIWGASAGSISVFDQLLLYGGNATYKGNPLFRGAIMDSGTSLAADPVNSTQSQAIYDQIVQKTGCSNATDSLNCLREAPYNRYLDATQELPSLFSFNSEALSFIPRPDGVILEDSPEQLVQKGRFHKVPIITGDQEDEGTLFSIQQVNVTSVDDMVEYLSKFLFSHVSKKDLKEYVNLYEPALVNGSPFRTGPFNELYPGYKRVAAIIGDAIFTGMRRATMKLISKTEPKIPIWAYQSSVNYGFPFVGTYHGSDTTIYTTIDLLSDTFIKSSRTYYLNFLYNLDPNKGASGFTKWPLWKDNQELLWFKTHNENDLIIDDFRSGPIGWIEKHQDMLAV